MTFLRRALVLVLAVGALLVLPVGRAPEASAHPPGNFTVNHHDGLVLHPDRVEVRAIVDTAEIPTVQERAGTDTDGDGVISPAEGAAHAAGECAEMLPVTGVRVDGVGVPLTVVSATAEYPVAEQGLPTTRVTCTLVGPTDLSGRPSRNGPGCWWARPSGPAAGQPAMATDMATGAAGKRSRRRGPAGAA